MTNLFETLGEILRPDASNSDQEIDLFEDYDNIPDNVKKILDKHESAFINGDYRGLNKALKKLEKIGYTFEYYLDGIAYNLRPIKTDGAKKIDL